MFTSIRWQIQLWHGLLLVAITATLLVGFYLYERESVLHRSQTELSGIIVSLMPRHIPPPGGTRRPQPPFPDPDLESRLEARGYYIRVWSPQHDVWYASPKAPATPIPNLPPGVHEMSRWSGGSYESFHVSPNGDILAVGMPVATMVSRLYVFALELALIGIGVVGVGLIGGWWIAGRAIRPIATIVSTAESIASGHHSRRIEIENRDNELGRLATVLNTTFDRLAQVYDQQVRFTADASHELRTPVSVILAQTQMALSREREAKAYREALEICQRSAQRMKALLGDLIDLSRYDSVDPEIRVRECDLAEVARESLEFIAPLATERQVKIHEDIDSIPAQVDPINLSHAFINLLTNAIKHNPEGCEIRVALKRKAGSIQFVVADSGQGIPAEAIPHLFDRFYRVDPSRARTTGGSGLGLSIAKAIAEAHGGTIEASSVVGEGTTFTFSLP